MKTYIENRPVVSSMDVQKPKGAYVAHNGKFWPADEGYPLAVIVDSSAQHGQVVLFPHGHGLIVAFGGQPERTHVVEYQDEQSWTSAISRLGLISNGPVLSAGDIDLPAAKAEINWDALPVVVTNKVAIKPVLSFVAAMFFFVGALALTNSKIGDFTSASNATIAALNKETADLATELSELEKQTAISSSAPVQRERVPLPAVTHSFAEEINHSTQQIEVRNGSLVK